MIESSELTNEYLAEVLAQIRHEKKYHKSKWFKPYPFQEKFYKAGNDTKRRLLMCANRVGKSFSEAMEMSFHLTGLYPEWWVGHRFDKPILAWAVGITGDSTRKVLQKELLGTPLGKDLESIGTGAVPKHLIDFDYLERDGHIVRIVKVKHVSGDSSVLEFRSTQQGEHTLMGATVDYIWLDEFDPYNSLSIYAQCVTRTATTGGHVVITATPEFGLTELIEMFLDEDNKELYWQGATWEDALHLDEETKKELLASIPEWQRDMRTRGLPVLGKGAVFAFKDSDVMCTKPEIDGWDDILWSLDLGEHHDETVLTLMVDKSSSVPDDSDEPQYYIYDQWVLGDDENGNNIRGYENVVKIIKSHIYCNAPIAYPSDGNKGGDGSYAQSLRNAGLNVLSTTARNPSKTNINGWGGDNKTAHAKSIEAGLHFMTDYMINGKLKVTQDCVEWFVEKRGYFRTGKKGADAFKGKDHCIDSSRYGFISVLGGRGMKASECQKGAPQFNYTPQEEYVYG
ncbi:hypothetical protein CGI18_07195 [Vibrio parahaemolyticus]|uniref:terminase large subunit domain-containing protein n=1 Tax=Vibrio parahaemolyticus TaxID=670 RepID=UPI00111F479D|nr:terminase family protein [Vibrio parahaemolyticus]TOK48270.1 hypothetical protein CGI18_07195 [Vibrio parahaemolyticus]